MRPTTFPPDMTLEDRLYGPDQATASRTAPVENPPTSLSNTRQKSVSSIAHNPNPAPQHWGVDTLKLGFSIDPTFLESSSTFWRSLRSRSCPKTGQRQVTLGGDLAFGGGDVRVTVFVWRALCHL